MIEDKLIPHKCKLLRVSKKNIIPWSKAKVHAQCERRYVCRKYENYVEMTRWESWIMSARSIDGFEVGNR